MKYFIAYRSTGEDLATLRQRMRRIDDALHAAGFETYNNAFEHERFDSSGMTPRQILDEGFGELDKCDGIFVLIASADKSEGQLMEVGYAYAKGMPVVVAVRSGVPTYVDAMADTVIRWQDVDDLCRQIAELRP